MHALTPIPIKTLDISRPAKFCAKANEVVPIIAIIKKEETIFLGPCLSNKKPKGICIHENPKKYPPANSPRFPAVRLNSDVRTGESVAVIDLNKLDIKNANAKTRNIKMLLFVLLIIYIFYFGSKILK